MRSTALVRAVRTLHLSLPAALAVLGSACVVEPDPDDLAAGEAAGLAGEPVVTALVTCTHYLDPAGDDGGDGSTATPWKTVAHAMATVAPGATVCARAGTYHENLLITRSGTAAAPITLTRDPAAPIDAVVLDGTIDAALAYPGCPPTLWIYGGAYLRVVGLTIRHGGNAGYPGNPFECTAGGLWVSPNYQAAVSAHDLELTDNVIELVAPSRSDHLGVPMGLSAYVPGVDVHHVRVLRNVFRDNDTINEGSGIAVGALAIAGDVHDFEVSGNTFDDPDTGGVETGGNQGNNLYPRHGVIAGNDFLDSGHDNGTAGVYLQASRDILIERNYFRGNGNSINLQTEPPCGVTSPVITGNVVVRNNVMVNPRHHQVVMGAFAGSNVCPPLGYLPVDNVYVTNNTLYRTGAGSLPSIYMPANGANTITGDSRILDNIIVTDGRSIDLTPPGGLPPPLINFNYHASPLAKPFTRSLLDLTWAQWRAQGHDTNSTLRATLPTSVFKGPVPSRAGFALKSSTPNPPRNAGAPVVSGVVPTTAPWASFGAYAPAVELDFYGGPRDRNRRDLGADEY